jgi:NAD(P)-dependent dehydrogenase (short-subunit alcohol dehydrogenase family)
LLAAVPRDESALVTILGQACTLRAAENGAVLVLTRLSSRDNKAERCEAVEASRAHELKERARDLERTKTDVLAKMEELSQNYQRWRTR